MSARSDAIKQEILESYYTLGDGYVRMARRTTRSEVGDIVGHPMLNGYLAVMLPVLRIKVYVHQVVYFLTTSVWPPDTGKMIDHVDRNRMNNHPSNLRLVFHVENNRNNSAKWVGPYAPDRVRRPDRQWFRVQMKTRSGRFTVQGFKDRSLAEEFAELLHHLAEEHRRESLPVRCVMTQV